jgi:hypothetical protein
MFHDQGCRGHVTLGPLPEVVRAHLIALPGEWLEFDSPSNAIVVRHVQPSTQPCLPTITQELVRMLAAVPVELHVGITGGELFVHTEDSPHVVRLRVEPGGEVRLDWAHPRFGGAARRRYAAGLDVGIDPVYCRLTGTVTLGAADLATAAGEIQHIADTFEGLYPEGDFQATANPTRGCVHVEMRDANLDIRLLVERVMRLATPGSANGAIEVSTFDVRYPDDRARVVFERGDVWVEEPTLFDQTPAAG